MPRRGGFAAIVDNMHMTNFKPAAIKPSVPISALEALDVRVGTIAAVEEVKGSNKLVRLRVDFGDHTRSILAGLKRERPDPSLLVGRQALFVVNLEPKRIAGEISEGMLFDLGYADGVVPVLAVPESPVPNGVRAG
jgi:tRNA-binding protein